MTRVVHNLLADAAKSIAHEAYECIAHDNHFYAEWPSREIYVERNWTAHLPDARSAFLEILGNPNYPEAMKQPIYEAMCIDGSMRAPKVSGVRTRTRARMMH